MALIEQILQERAEMPGSDLIQRPTTMKWFYSGDVLVATCPKCGQILRFLHAGYYLICGKCEVEFELEEK